MMPVNNKIQIIILAISISLNVSAQSVSELASASNELENIIKGSLHKNRPHLFRADIATIDTIIKRTSKRYKIVYSFSTKCYASLELFPKLVEFVNYNEEFELFPIYGYRDVDTVHIKEYLSYYKFLGNMFILDSEKYGNKRNSLNRIKKLTKSICKECDSDKMGYSSFYVFDENNNIVHHNNWTIRGLKKIEMFLEWYKIEK